jgi:hypothetical protein
MDIVIVVKLIISSIIVFFLPGYFIYNIFLKNLKLDIFQSLIISMGLSLSFIPLITYFFTLIGIKLNSFLIIALMVIFIIGILLKYKKDYKLNKDDLLTSKGSKYGLKKWDISPYFILIAILIISLVVRFIQVKDILVAPGSDSYHHTLIAQLIVENGGIPTSYLPYAPLASFTYHFGFHSLVAFFYWISGISIIKLVIFTAQILNAFALLSVFIFVDRLFKDKKMALLSSLTVGLISIFPAYYLNWGRFTQLTGMVILPIALLLVIESIKMEKRDLKVLFISGLLTSGLFLSHYRIIIAFFSFILLYFLYGIYQNRHNRKAVQENLIRYIVIAIIALVLLLPWFIHLMKEPQIITTANNSKASASAFSIERIGDAINYYSNLPLLFLSIGGILLGLFKRNKNIILITSWVLILIAFSNPFWMKLPGSGLLDFVTVVTILYFPVAVISSYFFIYLLQRFKISSSHNLLIFSICLAILVPFFAINMIGTFSPDSVYVRSGDLNAMNWIKANTEGNATFLIDAYSFDFLPEYITGIDGGYWIPIIAKRNVTIPPMTYLLEKPFDKNYVEKVVALSKAEESITSESTIDFLIKNNVSYIYFGGKNLGKLKLQNLQNNPYLEPVYSKYGVWIFRIKNIE